ncbi:hypothetical protein [Clostridium sp. 'White wine YQ']|uniref:hypothetical protein n=1 Tax=Clostridium sp. 'White wine YQ' TaxID=3027474 RepID=UPI0023659255|nr:hypothetical protein [Clostridium sp. 'White wine YQ']MDD7793255.1 hypothetical protein [Clostridium sp. 'White wine YQ']
MGLFLLILQTVIIFAVVLGAFYVLRKFVFNKLKISKWIPLAIAILLLAGQFLFKIQNGLQGVALTALTLLFFMWFLDLNQGGGPVTSKKQKQKQIEIRPKAKPNRVKNLNKDKKDK